MAETINTQTEEAPARVMEIIRNVAVVVPLVMSVLAALSPLFGDAGIANVVPLPTELEAVGRPLIAGISLFFCLAVFLVFWSSESGPKSKYIALATFLVSVLLIGLYLSWVSGNDVAPPEIGPVGSGVLGIAVIAFGIAFFASSLVILATLLVVLPRAQTGDDIPLAKQTMETTDKVPTIEPSSDHPEISAISRLKELVVTANWYAIAREGNNRREIYWRLYYLVAGLVTFPERGRREVGRVRFLVRVLSVSNVLFFWTNEQTKTQRLFLLGHINLLLPWIAERTHVWESINKLGVSPKDPQAAFQLYFRRFLTANSIPLSIGYVYAIGEAKTHLDELLAYRDQMTPYERLKVLQLGQNASALQRFQAKGVGGTSSIEKEFYASMILSLTSGERTSLARAAYESGADFVEFRKGTIANSYARHFATISAGQAFAIALAADTSTQGLNRIEALSFLVQESARNLHADTVKLAHELRIALDATPGKSALPKEVRTNAQKAIKLADALPEWLHEEI